ncbi:hypothetical protein CHUAL_000975 [Chamberlinius hualienensis]
MTKAKEPEKKSITVSSTKNQFHIYRRIENVEEKFSFIVTILHRDLGFFQNSKVELTFEVLSYVYTHFKEHFKLYQSVSCTSDRIRFGMALWMKAQNLPGELLKQVQSVYGEHFPIEVRHFLAQWIEEKPWNEIDPDNVNHEVCAAELLMALTHELETKASLLNGPENFLMKIKLSDSANHIRQNYLSNPLSLVRIVRHCLGTEMKLIQMVENPPVPGDRSCAIATALDRHQEILRELDVLKKRTQETEEDLRKMLMEQESFILQYQESNKLNAQIHQIKTQMVGQQHVEACTKLQQQKDIVDQGLNQRLGGLQKARMSLEEKHHETFQMLHAVQSKVLDEELILWKTQQRLAGNGSPFINNLDQIQELCELLAEIIWQNRQQIKRVEQLRMQLPLPITDIDKLPMLNDEITGLLSSVVTSTFIIEKQPPQVMKTNTKFTATVRLLVGGKLNVHMTPPQVKVTIISEVQANALLKNEMSKGEVSGEILNNTGTMEYHQATRQLSVSFRNMQLRKIKRAEKKGTESVMDEKFSLLFQSQFKVGGGELVFQVWTLSLPVVVIVHGNQEPHAWATVTWDNAFTEPGRALFAVPEKVLWPQMADVLNCKFRAAVGRGLSEDNIRFLAGKAFRASHTQDYSNMLLSWSQFCKEPLPERNFTFWEWFYAIMKLTREHLRGPWNDGSIIGFVNRKHAEEMLHGRSKGTFLLRFSDSELGGVTIAWLQEDPQTEQKEVLMLQPFTHKDFAIRSLADRINDLKPLVYLYPDIPKDQAFSKYYTPLNDNAQTASNGYVKPVLVTQVPGYETESGCYESYPATPQTFHAHSPDVSSVRDTPSVNSTSSDYFMNQGTLNSEVELDDLIGMVLPGDMDVGDYSPIDVGDLLGYKKE